MAEWYSDALKLRDFSSALEQAEYAGANDVLKKPYRFDDEFAAWQENNFPTQEDPEWDTFIDALNALGEGSDE